MSMKKFAEDILRHPRDHEWSLQGLGMLRTYLDADKVRRLHVWSPPHQTPGVALPHDHPWDFMSQVVAGAITDVVFMPTGVEQPGSRLWNMHHIMCGPNACAESEVEQIRLYQLAPRSYAEGHYYKRKADVIHASFPIEGTTTIITRQGDTEHARVFWPVGKPWVTARPRPATNEEVDAIVGTALHNWF
jgi:hypothetical protein